MYVCIYVCIYLSIHLSLSIYLSIYISIYLSIYLTYSIFHSPHLFLSISHLGTISLSHTYSTHISISYLSTISLTHTYTTYLYHTQVTIYLSLSFNCSLSFISHFLCKGFDFELIFLCQYSWEFGVTKTFELSSCNRPRKEKNDSIFVCLENIPSWSSFGVRE